MTAGLRAIPPSRLETIRLLSGGNKREVFHHVVRKELIPHFIVAFRIAFAFCMIIVVVSEMIWGTSTPGIGTRVKDALAESDSPRAWGIVILLGIMGILANRALDVLERRLVFWRETTV